MGRPSGLEGICFEKLGLFRGIRAVHRLFAFKSGSRERGPKKIRSYRR